MIILRTRQTLAKVSVICYQVRRFDTRRGFMRDIYFWFSLAGWVAALVLGWVLIVKKRRRLASVSSYRRIEDRNR